MRFFRSIESANHFLWMVPKRYEKSPPFRLEDESCGEKEVPIIIIIKLNMYAQK